MGTPSTDRATENLVKWAMRGEWAPLHEEFHASYLEPVVDNLEMPADVLDLFPHHIVGMLSVFILEGFFTTRFGEHGERNVVDDYLKRRGWRESVPGRRYLKALKDSTLSLYEIVDVAPGHYVTVRDLVLGGEAVRVDNKHGSKVAALRDCLAARVVAVHGKNHFTDGVLPFRYELSQQLLPVFEEFAEELERDMRDDTQEIWGTIPATREMAREVMVRTPFFARSLLQFWMYDTLMRTRAAAPELRNSDDEEVLLCKVHFPLAADETRVASALDGIAELEREEDDAARWRWVAAGSPTHRVARHHGGGPAPESSEDAIGTTSLGHAEIGKRTLVLSVNSRERAERGQELLASRLGSLVEPSLIVQQTIEKAMEELTGPAPDEPEIPPEEAMQIVHLYLDNHYRRTLDDPLPMLDGKTPREAARTREGRPQVIDWLKQLENMEHRRAIQEGHEPYDMAWLWRELGLEMPR